jgi:hypothetical protein
VEWQHPSDDRSEADIGHKRWLLPTPPSYCETGRPVSEAVIRRLGKVAAARQYRVIDGGMTAP